MPTGYTAKILDGCSFEEFVWAVARNFGALIMMRDEPSNAPIPERFEPSDYYLKRLEEAKADALKLSSSSLEERQAMYSEYEKKLLSDRQITEEKNASTEAKYRAMREKVEKWEPPTHEHVGMKSFMLKQIDESIEFDIIDDKYLPTFLTFDEWLAGQMERAKRDVEYYEKEHAEEVKRTEKRNAWLKALRDSLKNGG